MKAIRKISFVLLSILAILALCFSITAITSTQSIAHAEDTTDVTTPTEETEVTTPTNEAKIVKEDGTETEYATLADANDKAVAGDTIVLLKDVSLSAKLTITKSITFELNGKTVTTNAKYFWVEGANIEVKFVNGTIKNTLSKQNAPAIYVKTAKTFNMKDVNIESVSNYGFWSAAACNAKFENCNISGTKYGISASNLNTLSISGGSVSSKSDYAILISKCSGLSTMTECAISSENVGIGLSACTGDTTITNCTITAPWGVYSLSNAGLTIDGGTITSTARGIVDYSKGNSTIKNCVVKDGDYGMFIKKETATTTVSNVQILNTYWGMTIYWPGAVIIDNCTIDSNGKEGSIGITGNGGIDNGVPRGNTNITVNSTTINADCGIYHPQEGRLFVNAGTITAKYTGIEVRAGSVTLQNGAEITVDPSTTYSNAPNPSGTTVQGVALAVSQHYDSRHADINVLVKDATLTANKSLVQVDTKPNEQKVNITMNVDGGTFNGGVQTDRVYEFINGGRFSEDPNSEYINPSKVVITDNKYFLVTSYNEIDRIRMEVNDYVRLYASTKGILYTEEIYSILNKEGLTTLDAILQAKEEAVAKVDKLYDELCDAKQKAIGRIIDAANAAKVVVPTATLSAINDAMNTKQVETFETNAINEINDICAFRKQVSDLGAKGDEILSAIDALNKALFGDGDNGKLAEIKKELLEALATAQKDINDKTADGLAQVEENLTNAINNAVETLTGEIAKNVEKLDTIIKQLVEAFDITLDAETNEYVSSEIQAIKDALATLDTELNKDHDAILEEIGKANTSLSNLTETLRDVQETVNGIVNGILESKAFKALATEENVDAVKTAVADVQKAITDLDSSLLNETNGAIPALKKAILEAIAGVKTVVDSNATALETLGVNVDAIKAKVDTLENTDLTAVEKALGEIKTELDNVMIEVKKVVNDVITSDAFKALATQTDVVNAQKAVEGFVLENNDAIEALKSVLNTAIANVQKTANDNADALKALGADVTAIKTKVETLNNADLTTLEQKIADVKTSIQTAVADADKSLTAKLATLTSNVATLTGRLNEVNSGLLAELDVVKDKIDGIKLVSGESLAETLNAVKVELDAVAAKVFEAVNVEEEKAKACDKINKVMNNLLGSQSANETEVVLLATADSAQANGLISAQRDKLHAMYNDKMADLIESYYNDAIADVQSATTVDEVQSAVNNFKSNIDSAKLMNSLQSAQDGESGISIDDVYVMIIIAVVFAACALVLTTAVYVQKRRSEKE